MGNRRIWWGVGIMAAGLCAALPFRKTWLAEHNSLVDTVVGSPADPPKFRPTVLSGPALADDELSPAIAEVPSALEPLPLASALERGIAQRSLVRVEERPPIPELPTDYRRAIPSAPLVDPRAAVLAENDTSPVIASEAPPPDRRRYRILKHDTLESIAQRLLGSRQHADKLLAANADVILAPDVLPVGATIVIPDLSLPAETIVRRPEEDR